MPLCKRTGCKNVVPLHFKEFCSRECFSLHIKAGTRLRKERNASWSVLWERAHAAGLAAGHAVVPATMVVERRTNPMDDSSPVEKSWEVPDGVCGFAWVEVSSRAFLGWRRKVDPNYHGGRIVRWVYEFNQSLTRKLAYAQAFAEVLNEGGVPAHAHDRID